VERRVEQLAASAGLSVDTVRFYQARGLLPPPRREGRVAWYGDDHVRRLERIRQLQAQGLTLATIKRLLGGRLGPADAALASAVELEATAGTTGDGTAGAEGGGLGIEEVARRSGIPLALLRAAEQAGVLVPRRVGGSAGYSVADVEAARAGLVLLEHGIPLADVLELGRRHQAAVNDLAATSVALFDAHVRQPLRAAGLEEDEAAGRLVEAFDALLPATVAVVAHQFRSTLLALAEAHLDRAGEAVLEPL